MNINEARDIIIRESSAMAPREMSMRQGRLLIQQFINHIAPDIQSLKARLSYHIDQDDLNAKTINASVELVKLGIMKSERSRGRVLGIALSNNLERSLQRKKLDYDVVDMKSYIAKYHGDRLTEWCSQYLQDDSIDLLPRSFSEDEVPLPSGRIDTRQMFFVSPKSLFKLIGFNGDLGEYNATMSMLDEWISIGYKRGMRRVNMSNVNEIQQKTTENASLTALIQQMLEENRQRDEENRQRDEENRQRDEENRQRQSEMQEENREEFRGLNTKVDTLTTKIDTLVQNVDELHADHTEAAYHSTAIVSNDLSPYFALTSYTKPDNDDPTKKYFRTWRTQQKRMMKELTKKLTETTLDRDGNIVESEHELVISPCYFSSPVNIPIQAMRHMKLICKSIADDHNENREVGEARLSMTSVSRETGIKFANVNPVWTSNDHITLKRFINSYLDVIKDTQGRSFQILELSEELQAIIERRRVEYDERIAEAHGSKREELKEMVDAIREARIRLERLASADGEDSD